ncbi:CidA/LrgA family protein [Erwinia tracheiphila]|nr:CidA/LrgA family protein [Erwinia tracheiphila]UIA88465.1 CidA/LrgA family protein [Erwinia tracheiphila]UIA96843.1 CidA/LrgA family protein [Erwinia tracheiphila]
MMLSLMRSQRCSLLQRVQVPLQAMFYIAFFVFTQQLVDWLHLPLPANVVGLLLLLTMIVTGALPFNWVRDARAG